MTVGSLLRANALTISARDSEDFELVFRPINMQIVGVVVVIDAALGKRRS